MASSISELRKRVSQVATGVQSGTLGASKSYDRTEDSRMFYPKLDEKGSGFAIIRFLPAAEGKTLHWSQAYSHGFQGPGGKWFIEECPTTIGKECPICSENSNLWNSGLETDKQLARSRKRKLTYYYNILVVSHPANPADEGTVRIFKSGPTVFNMLLAAQKPEFPDEPVIDAFDPWGGANFNLRIYKDKDKNTKYDKSKFEAASSMGDDAYIEKVWRQCHNLDEFVAPSKYKTAEELTAKLNQVLGQAAAPAQRGSVANSEPTPSAGRTEEPRKAAPAVSAPSVGSDEEDPLALFEAMANGN